MRRGEPMPRFTARGGAAVEAEIAQLVARIGALVAADIAPSLYRALILLGGYGRGEGGIERVGSVERPHNNLDLLLITTLRGAARRGALKQRLDALLGPLAASSGVGIDTGVISAVELRAAPCRVMWFDMRHGHRTILGDPSLVPSLRRFRLEAIEPDDMRNLLVNRGTLLVINDHLLARGAATEEDRRLCIKHAMKAIIGYGDATLFSRAEYAASYADKQRRMRARRDVGAAFRALYDEAIEFRFEPAYQRYLGRDLRAWMDHLRAGLSSAHLSFEAWRLGAGDLTFADYPAHALRHALGRAARSPRALARAGRDLLTGRRPFSVDRLAAALPTVLYGEASLPARELTRRALDAADTSPGALRRAYLAAWGRSGDTNAPVLLDHIEVPS